MLHPILAEAEHSGPFELYGSAYMLQPAVSIHAISFIIPNVREFLTVHPLPCFLQVFLRYQAVPGVV